MNNKLLAALALTTALATTAHAGCQINSGAYVGLSAGGAHLGGKGELNQSNTDVAGGGVQPSSSHKLSANSFNGIIFAGYGLKFGSVWCAAEILYQFDNLSSKTNVKQNQGPAHNGVNTESKTTGAFGGAIHIGALVNPNVAVYAIIGAEGRSFRVKFSDNEPNGTACTINKRYTSTAFTPGVGFRVNICKNIALKTEYKYAMHQSKKFTSDTKHGPLAGDDTVTLKHTPNIQSFNVGLIYNF